VLEVGSQVPLAELKDAMQDWFRRKGYLKAEQVILLSESSH
jgi:hypothetical protein